MPANGGSDDFLHGAKTTAAGPASLPAFKTTQKAMELIYHRFLPCQPELLLELAPQLRPQLLRFQSQCWLDARARALALYGRLMCSLRELPLPPWETVSGCSPRFLEPVPSAL